MHLEKHPHKMSETFQHKVYYEGYTNEKLQYILLTIGQWCFHKKLVNSTRVKVLWLMQGRFFCGCQDKWI